MSTAFKSTQVEKVHLFDLPSVLLIFVIESLMFEDIVCLVDIMLLSNTKVQHLWHAEIKGLLRCPDMGNRIYSEESLR